MGKKLQAQRKASRAKAPAGNKAARSKAKKTARLDATLYNPSEILSGRDLRGAVNQLVKLETQPQIKAADRTAREARMVGNEQVRRSEVYGGQLDKVQTDNYSMQSALKERAMQSLSDISTQEAHKVDSSGQDAYQGWSKDASVRGEGLEGGGEARMAAETQAAKNRQAGTALAYRSAEEMAGTARLGLASASRDASINRSKETEGTLRNRTQATVNDALVKKQDVLASRGGLATQLALKMRGDEFEKLATIQGLGLKREGIAADAAEADARIQATIRGQDVSAATSRANNRNTNSTSRSNNANTNATSASNNANTNATSASNNANTNATSRANNADNNAVKLSIAAAKRRSGQVDKDSRKARRAIRNISTIYKSNLTAGKNRPAIARLLRGKRYESPPDLLNAGADLANFGYVLPVHVQALRDGGIKVPSRWTKPTAGGKYKPPKKKTGGSGRFGPG